MIKTKKQTLSRKETNKFNQIILGIFLFIVFATLALRIIIGILTDLGIGFQGTSEAKFGFWNKPWENLSETDKLIINQHPNTLWYLTQFTWLTTLVIIVFVFFRFFKFEKEKIPKWLKWIMTQKTLTIITIYDIIVGVVFWASMAQGFGKATNNVLAIPEYVITFLVHAIIPLFMVIYSSIFLINDPEAEKLKTNIIIQGWLFPFFYTLLYAIFTLVWYDPYPVTNMHEILVTKGIEAWAKELWMAPVVWAFMYVAIGLMVLLHNYLLQKYNKHWIKKNPAHKNKKHKLWKFK